MTDKDRKQFNVEGMNSGKLFMHFMETSQLETSIRRGACSKRLGNLSKLRILHEINGTRNSLAYREIKICRQFLEGAIVLYTNRSDSDDEILIASITTADYFISAKNNQPEIDRATAPLSNLAEAIRASNDCYTSTDELFQVSKNISALKENISQPHMHASANWETATSSSALKRLKKQTYDKHCCPVRCRDHSTKPRQPVAYHKPALSQIN
ncbi:hypothetical protein [Acidocella sp.]|uniref:hypothetical protein n=1 Tax=Acidocella sp. TaxID=50710 RepID=UPI002601C14C|nr:hypothetical protein [Acidocella sp.]